MNVKVKHKIPFKIKRMGINGEGIGFYKKTLVFVPGALKGEDIFCFFFFSKRFKGSNESKFMYIDLISSIIVKK